MTYIGDVNKFEIRGYNVNTLISSIAYINLFKNYWYMFAC